MPDMAEPADRSAASAASHGAASAADHGSVRTAARRRRWRWVLAEAAVLAAGAALLVVVLRAFAFQTFYIPSSSMVPTLGVGDRIVVQKAFFSWHDVREGDIVVFSHPPLDACGGPQGGDLVKRVVALPGQAIYSAGSSVYVDGQLLAEPYLPHDEPLGPPIASWQHPYRVPPGDFYVLGDNRVYSCDSRFWGPVAGSSIIGKVTLMWWHGGHPDFRLARG
jgi:signal peptidase I